MKVCAPRVDGDGDFFIYWVLLVLGGVETLKSKQNQISLWRFSSKMKLEKYLWKDSIKIDVMFLSFLKLPS